jgi:hypothetical protein
LKKNNENDTIVLFLILEEMLSVYPMMLAVGLSYITFIMLRYNPSIPPLSGLLSWKNDEFSQMILLHLLRRSHNFILILLLWYIIFIELHVLNHPSISGIKPTWSWWVIFFIPCWIQFANVLLGNAGLIEWVWKNPFLLVLWNSLRRISISSSLRLW